MSIDLPYPVRLYWDNSRGTVRLLGRGIRPLQTPPVIDGLPLYTMLDYVPSTVQIIQPLHYKVRDLDREECACVERWLTNLKGLW
jgi:hypothetical protein